MPEASQASRDILRARDAPPGAKPGLEDLKPAVVSKRVLKDCAEHPATIYPLVGSALAVAWTVIIAASPASLMVAVGLAVLGACSFVYNFVLKGKERVVSRQQELMALRRQHDLYAVYSFGLECQALGFEEGAKEAGELIIAYEKLARYLAGREGGSAETFARQAEEVYKQGGESIHHALELYKALNSVDVRTLKRELKTWQNRRDKLDDKAAEARTLDRQIEAHVRRLEQFDERTQELADLFATVNDVEEALETTYLDLVQIGNNPSKMVSQTGAADRLRNAVAARRRVDEKIRGVGEETEEAREKRNKYIQLARQAACSKAGGEGESEIREEE